MKHSALRVRYSHQLQSTPLCCSTDVCRFLRTIWDTSLMNIQEQIYCIFLNNNNEVISWRCINTGSSRESIFDLKFTLSCALNCMATKIILAHNHPCGQLKPSYHDKVITEKLLHAAALLDISLEDHLIITTRDYFSFRDNRLLKP